MKKRLSILLCAFISLAPGIALAYGTPVFDAEYADGNTWSPTTGSPHFSSEYYALSSAAYGDTLYYAACVHQTTWVYSGSINIFAGAYYSPSGGGSGTTNNYTNSSGTPTDQICWTGTDVNNTTFTSGLPYWLDFEINGWWGGNTYTWGSGDYLRIADGGTPPPPVVDTTTRIISTTPADGSVIATTTSTSIGANVYINEADYEPGAYVQIQYVADSALQASVASPSLLYTTVNFQITGWGESDFATTSPISTTGHFTVKTTIYNVNKIDFFNLFSITIGQTALMSTSTGFTVGGLSPYDVLVQTTAKMMSDYVNNASSSLASCGFTSFDITGCAGALFIPNMASTTDLVKGFKNGFLSYAPWGYVTRFMTIMAGGGSATSSLPILDATIPLPDGSPAEFYIDPNTFIPQGAAMLNSATATFGPGQGESFQTIIEPVWDELLALLVTIAIIFNMLGTHKEGGGGHKNKLS